MTFQDTIQIINCRTMNCSNPEPFVIQQVQSGQISYPQIVQDEY